MSINFDFNSKTNETTKSYANYQLDLEFDQHLAGMKKYILELKDKKSKQLCAMWIKKLCEITDTDDLTAKRTRNSYSAKLFKNLESQQALQHPFDDKPPFDLAGSKNLNLNLDLNNEFLHESEQIYSETDFQPSANQNGFMYNYSSLTSVSKFDDKQRSAFIQNVDNQVRQLETKFKEEKIKLQQAHNEEIQNIIERKNSEIENLKSGFSKKKRDYEATINNFEKKVIQMTKEMTKSAEEYEKNVSSLKRQVTELNERRQTENEKKLKDIIQDYEAEKFELQKQHTRAFQDLVDETNQRLKKVECEYNQQQNITEHVMLELENKAKMLKNEIEKSAQIIKSLEKENKEKSDTIECLKSKYEEVLARCSYFENDNKQVKESHNLELNRINAKIDSMISSKNEEYATALAKIDQMSHEANKTRVSYEKKIEKLNNLLKEKENSLTNSNNIIIQQKLQAELALNELKKEIETNSNKLFEEMKEQLFKLENELEKTQTLKEKQANEFTKQMEELKKEHLKQIEKLNCDLEKEKLSIKHVYEIERLNLNKQNDKRIDEMHKQCEQQIFDNNKKCKSKIETLNAIINQMEKKMFQLEQELSEANSLRKQQITELGLLREDEKIKLSKTSELEIETIRSNHELEISQLKKQMKQHREDANIEIARLNEEILRLQKIIKDLEIENRQNQEHFESELRSIQKQNENRYSKLEQDYEMELNKNKTIEKRAKKISIEHENEIVNLKMQYEEKLKGVLSVEAKKDYDDTISALKSQIESLQQRAILLQSELDDRNNLINSSSFNTGSI